MDAAATPILLVHGFIGNHAIFACDYGLLHMNPAAAARWAAIHKLQRWFQPSMNASIAATRSLAEVKVRTDGLAGDDPQEDPDYVDHIKLSVAWLDLPDSFAATEIGREPRRSRKARSNLSNLGR